jgi:serine-type D-Ala-D-Ala endopeptidase (penicillin-binding protein 7)
MQRKHFVLTLFFTVLSGATWANQPLLLSSRALIFDVTNQQTLVAKNAEQIASIASITKLMTAMVVIDAQQPYTDKLRIDIDDFDFLKGSKSRLGMGSELTRYEMLELALMSSENRAAHALGRAYPGGLDAAISAMNVKAKSLGMNNTRFVDPTGLSAQNVSTARDLVKLVSAAEQYPLIRELSTKESEQIAVEGTGASLQYNNSNALVKNPDWQILLQKTGYIAEAGKCVVLSTLVAGRKVIMVLLDSAGRHSRLGDAHRVKHWVSTGEVLPLPKPEVKKAKLNKRGGKKVIKGKAKGRVVKAKAKRR